VSDAARSRVAAWADAIGHCLLVFAFVPPLAALPRWLGFEVTNALDVQDPLVLVFLPVRGVILLLNEFRDGVVPGIFAGVLNGLALCAWTTWRGAEATLTRRLGVGAAAGLAAAGVMVVVTLMVIGDRSQPLPLGAILFEIGSGVVCGAIAAPRAFALLSAAPAPADPRPRSSARRRSSPADTSRPA
jgi:hypothetical protein